MRCTRLNPLTWLVALFWWMGTEYEDVNVMDILVHSYSTNLENENRNKNLKVTCQGLPSLTSIIQAKHYVWEDVTSHNTLITFSNQLCPSSDLLSHTLFASTWTSSHMNHIMLTWPLAFTHTQMLSRHILLLWSCVPHSCIHHLAMFSHNSVFSDSQLCSRTPGYVLWLLVMFSDSVYKTPFMYVIQYVKSWLWLLFSLSTQPLVTLTSLQLL